ncbi:DegT/DnrJ/EryC1/StrS family aminotransferase [Desulfosediminicola flagellatus]|uniref:DegT/DnrJ/EryC1/StrS family aminotransferase n=1 Tax=Desulfosediminicola flagellatus TaxID=2569541 RepID=UPI001E2A687D|nr:DegT/DnrJ/EryC1/StrS family aminotransferase [Desulfosediminicola flagellatus]
MGTNGKMTEICAAMGLINMNHLDEILVVNERSYTANKDGLAGVGGLRLLSLMIPKNVIVNMWL